MVNSYGNGEGPRNGKKNRRKDEDRPAPPLLDRTPPCDTSAEIGVLGSIILMPDVCDELVMIIKPDDFYDDAHRKLYQHMIDMVELGQKIDITLLVNRLKTAEDYEAVGGSAYLAQLANRVPNAAHATYYAQIVRDKATMRRLIEASTSILRDAYEESCEANQLLSQAEQRVFSIQDERSGKQADSIADLLTQAMERIDARMKGTHAVGGVATHFDAFDAQCGGLHDGELVILAARPSMGKTALALNIAENVSVVGRDPVLFVSLEMSGVELADRLLCSLARVNGHKLRNGSISQEERKRLVQKAVEVSNAPLYVDDSPSRTVSEVAAVARRIKQREKRLGLIVIDYLQLIEPDNSRDPRQEQVAKIARRLKGLAREQKVPVLCLSQLNRQAEEGKDHRPRMSHLRESGAIEQDADVVMFVHREEYYQRGEAAAQFAGQAEIIIAKQRNGPVGEIQLTWEKEYTRFQDRAPERHADFDHMQEPSFVTPGGF